MTIWQRVNQLLNTLGDILIGVIEELEGDVVDGDDWD